MQNYLPLFMTRRTTGEESNDIFDIQARIRQSQSHTDVTDYHKQKENMRVGKISKFEDINSADVATNVPSACRRSLSEGKIPQDPLTRRSPPVAVGKENIGTHFKGCMSPRVSMSNVAKSVENTDEESSEDETSSGMSLSRRKPTTQEEEDNNTRIRLADCTNLSSSVNQKQEMLEQIKPRRPCIKVREPPGGKSSIVFY